MNKQITRLTLDVGLRDSYKVVFAKMGDTERRVIAEIKDNGEDYSLAGVNTVEVRCRKADGKQVTKNATKDNNTKGGTYCKRKIERAIARKNRKGKTYKNVKHTKYWEALDIKKCYDNILHCFLKFRLIKMFKDKRLLELLFMCIDIYWVKETAAGKRGIPIGTPFGHWFANIMLTPVDFVIKHIFKIKYYFRYMDDMLLFSSNKKKLRQFVACIRDALSRIGLHIKSKLQVHATNDKGKLGNRPIDFIEEGKEDLIKMSSV